MLLRAESKRVDVDTGVWGAGVAEERLDKVEVRAFTLREAVLAVELELGSDDWVLAPTVELEGGLREHEGSSIRHVGFRSRPHSGLRHKVRLSVVSGRSRHVPDVVARDVHVRIDGASVLEQAIRGDEVKVVGATLTSLAGDGVRTAERVDRIGEGIDRIGVVEWLGTQYTVEDRVRLKGGTVVHVRVWLDDPDELLDGVVKVKLDLVRGRADRLIARELELVDEVLVGVLGHTAALIRVEEHVVHEERCRYKRLVVSLAYLDRTAVRREGVDRPEALINRAKIDVDTNLVVLESNEREGKTWVLAEPELERDVESGFWESIAGRTDLARGVRLARTVDVGEGRIREVSQLGGVSNHRVVALLLARGHRQLIPDVHPVSVVAVNALTTNLDFNLGNKLLAREIKPTGIDTVSVVKILTDLWESYLENGVVGKIAVT